MSNNPQSLQSEFSEKQQKLENARRFLKEEFIGIDAVIDQVIDNTSSWYLLPEIQEKPVIINLWGLTGVGKTSLINRLVTLLEYEDTYFRFDLGEKEGSFSFRDSLDDLCENSEDSPIIIALDEIQHSRTIDIMGGELGTDRNRLIWELIDSGRIQYLDWKRGLWNLENMAGKLGSLLKAGVEVEKGEVISMKELYCREMKTHYDPDEKIWFVPEDEYATIVELAGKQLGLHLENDVAELLRSLSAQDTIIFLLKVVKIGKRPSVKYFTKALIFILGNLDEAYTMSNNFSADMDADEFLELSGKITVPIIKKALRARFRSEQIARLGNIHIIYPALSKNSYKKIIRNELEKYRQSLKNQFGFEIIFSPSVYDAVYEEGVYPVQGVRPVFTTIQQILKSKMSRFLSEVFLESIQVDQLTFHIEGKKITCIYSHYHNQVHTVTLDIVRALDDARVSRKDDFQAITAVHESGHAVLSVALMGVVPEVIFSVSADSQISGFVYAKIPWEYVSKKELIPRVAVMLGGLAAEELVFGSQNVTSGSVGDIERATGFLSAMLKYSGLGYAPLAFDVSDKANDKYHSNQKIEEQIFDMISEAKSLAMEVLKREFSFLLALSDHLSDHRMLRKSQIRAFADKELTQRVDYHEGGGHIYYREHLKKLLKKAEESFIDDPVLSNPIVGSRLNKDGQSMHIQSRNVTLKESKD